MKKVSSIGFLLALGLVTVSQAHATERTARGESSESEMDDAVDVDLVAISGHDQGTNSSEVSAPSFVYLRCNTTSWQLDDKNLLLPAGTGYSLRFNVSSPWMLDSGDSCVFTVTDVKGTWTPNTREYLPTLPVGAKEAFENQGYVATPGNGTFRLKFSSLGDYTAFFNVKDSLFYVMKLQSH